MGRAWCLLLLLCDVSLAAFTDPGCVFELECEECLPEHMPLVTSHRAHNGSVVAATGDEVVLSCAGGKFLRYPLMSAITCACEAGRLRVRTDGALRHILDLGCQENVFEDVQHDVEHCAPPLQGRAYLVSDVDGARHLASVCFDSDLALPVRAHVSGAASAPPPHHHSRAPLTLLGNFNHMFDARTRRDAERLYSDDARLNRRLRELFKHERVAFAAQTITSGRLLSGRYFEDQDARVADFASNRVAVWSDVGEGNLRRVHEDVSALIASARPHRALRVYAGTHGAMTLRTDGGAREVFLRPDRFPVPKYIWTVVHDERRGSALAVVVLNDPFVSVSEIRADVFCSSACGRARWARGLRAHRRYETPAYGLAFCCDVGNFTDVVHEMPKRLLRDVRPGEDGMLVD